MLYGCELWGTIITQPNNIISKFINKFYKIILGVPSHTSTTGIHLELGRFSVDVDVQSLMLKYWARLISLPHSRLVSMSYWSLFDNPHFFNVWLNSIKNLIFSTGQFYVWNNQRNFTISDYKFLLRKVCYLKQNLKDQFILKSSQKMHAESKLMYFKNGKHTLSLSNYLSKIGNRDSRTLLSKLRLGVLPLEIEKGRQYNLSRSERICKFCQTNSVEDELHFLFECPVFETSRSISINLISNVHPNFHLYSSEHKLNYLYFNENLSKYILRISSDMLSKLFEERKKLIAAHEGNWHCKIVCPLVICLRKS